MNERRSGATDTPELSESLEEIKRRLMMLHELVETTANSLPSDAVTEALERWAEENNLEADREICQTGAQKVARAVVNDFRKKLRSTAVSGAFTAVTGLG